MADGYDAKLSQIISCQVWQRPIVYAIFAKCSLVLLEPYLPQPGRDIHGRLHN